MNPPLTLITGASRGLGRAVAEQLLARQHQVVAISRQAPQGLSSPRLCGGSGTPPGSGGVLLFSKLSAGVFPNIAALVAGLDALLSAQPFADPFAPARIATGSHVTAQGIRLGC